MLKYQKDMQLSVNPALPGSGTYPYDHKFHNYMQIYMNEELAFFDLEFIVPAQ